MFYVRVLGESSEFKTNLIIFVCRHSASRDWLLRVPPGVHHPHEPAESGVGRAFVSW